MHTTTTTTTSGSGSGSGGSSGGSGSGSHLLLHYAAVVPHTFLRQGGRVLSVVPDMLHMSRGGNGGSGGNHH